MYKGINLSIATRLQVCDIARTLNIDTYKVSKVDLITLINKQK